MADKTIGMMDAGFFVGRTELLTWLNDILRLGYTKVEQVCSGAAHCQILDSCFPGRVPLHKVNFNAKLEYEYVKNYKVLQDAFTRLGINKHIEVEKLIKGRYQDNLEFLQWMKRYWDLHHNPSAPEYNAVAERQRGPSGYHPGSAKPAAPDAPPATSTAPSGGPKLRTFPGRDSSGPSGAHAPHLITTTGSQLLHQQQHPPPQRPSGSLMMTNAQPDLQRQRTEELSKKVVELSSTIECLEKERDWYFAKLREVEVIVQKHPGEPLFADIERVLYATEEAQTTPEVPSEEAAPSE